MEIISALKMGGEGSVLADEFSGIVRLWTLAKPFQDGRKMRSLKRFFPYLEVKGEFIRLGGYPSVSEAQHWVAEAKMTSWSPAVQNLFRYDVPESLATLKHIS
jgi:hypothetical protein